MSKKWFRSIFLVMVSSLLILAACATETYSGEQSLPGEAGSNSPTTNPVPANGQTQTDTQNETVTIDNLEVQAGNTALTNGNTDKESTYKFSVVYPSVFVLRNRSSEQMATYNPVPVAAFMYMNPTAASSQAPDEPGDLEVRVYQSAGITSIDKWLNSVGLSNGSNAPKVYKTANVTGVEVCSPMMIAPNCSYFIMGKDWVYQLMTMTLEGESMLKTFTLLP